MISSNMALAGVFNIAHLKEEFPNLHEHFELLSDPEGTFAIDELAQGIHSGGFEPYAEWSQKKLQSGTVYWAKITLQSQLDRYSEWVLFTGSNNYVDVYIQSVVGFKLKKAGFYDDLEDKDIQEGRESKVSFSINSGESKTIYIRYANIGGNSPSIESELVQPEVFYKQIQWRNLFQGAFQGIMAIFFFYNLLIFLLNRDKTYLYYAFYIFVSGLYFFNWAGFTREYLVKDGIVIWQSIWIYAIALQPTFYIWFMRSFLTTPKLLPKWDKFFKIVPWVMVGGLVIQLVMYYTTFSVKLIANVTMIQTLISYLVMLFCLVVIIFKTRSTLAVYFTIGSMALWIGVFMGTFILLVVYNGIGGSFVSWAQTGIVAEVILFSLGLGYRMKKNEEDKRKAQEGLIEQLETNQELQTKVNRELERKVKERTTEIESQKEEIETQKESVEQAYLAIQDKNKLIEKKNQDITASINYAKRIQNAILPSVDRIKQSIDDIFVIFRPRDIVSGDFYWFSEIEVPNAQPLKVIAAVDCTGHGVPGAIMSMIGNDLLSESVRLQGMSDPAQILDYLNSHLKDRLQQDIDTTVRDGMDIALCVIDPNKKELRFAGAKNPLFYVRDGEVQEVRGDKFPIGGYKNKTHAGFGTHIIPLTDSPTSFYICSDGYQDQFGGEKGLKFMKKNMKGLFSLIYQQDSQRQQEMLDKTLDKWMNDTKQIDDILLIGFKA